MFYLSDNKNHNNLWQEFVSKGLDTRKNELWKYINLTSLYQNHNLERILNKKLEQKSEIIKKINLSDAYYHIVFANTNIIYSDLDFSQFKLDDSNCIDNLDLLSKATYVNGIDLTISKSLEKPLLITYISDENQAIINYRNKISIEPNIKLNIIERHIQLNKNHTTAVNIHTLLNIENNSICNYDFKKEDKQSSLICTNLEVNIKKNAIFNSFIAHQDNLLFRSYMIINLLEYEAKANIYGIANLIDNNICAYHILTNHFASYTDSNVFVRGVVNNKAKFIFNAKAYVKHGIKGIKAIQNNKNIQLSNQAEINTKPELEIYADDVVCSHGATIGSLDNNSIFYLMSRGIRKDKAKKLLIDSFSKEAISLSQREDYIYNHHII